MAKAYREKGLTYDERPNPLARNYGDIHLQVLAAGLFEIYLNIFGELAASLARPPI